MNRTCTRDIIVIGSSAGGVSLLRKLTAALPARFPAAIFVALHTAAHGPAFLAEILDQAGPLRAEFPKDGDPIEAGRIYVAPPDHHLMLDPGKIVLIRGPRENRFRPAIDPLFRSAAVHYGPRVIGVILSGMLDDGAAGLRAVKDCGGVAIVQDPGEADYPDMIRAAMRAVKPDHCIPADDLPGLLATLIDQPAPMPNDEITSAIRLQIENDMAAMRGKGARDVAALGKLSRLVCPECNGSLWELEDDHILRFRCHIGHAYSAESLASDQADALERAISIALRTLDDSAALCRRLALEAKESNRVQSNLLFERRAREAEENAATLRRVFQSQSRNGQSEPARPSADGASASAA